MAVIAALFAAYTVFTEDPLQESFIPVVSGVAVAETLEIPIQSLYTDPEESPTVEGYFFHLSVIEKPPVVTNDPIIAPVRGDPIETEELEDSFFRAYGQTTEITEAADVIFPAFVFEWEDESWVPDRYATRLLVLDPNSFSLEIAIEPTLTEPEPEYEMEESVVKWYDPPDEARHAVITYEFDDDVIYGPPDEDSTLSLIFPGVFAGSVEYEYVGSGSIVVGGTAIVSKEKKYLPTGGIVVGGSGAYSQDNIYVGSGTIVVGGSSPHSKEKSYRGTGTMTVGGGATYEFVFSGAASVMNPYIVVYMWVRRS